MINNPEIQVIWQEIMADLSTPAAFWQLMIVALSVGVAFAINGALRAYFLTRLPDNMKPVLGVINRILFPISALVMVSIARYACSGWMHVGMLRVASRLLLAMAVIRVLVYALRYIFSPSGWLKALENVIAWSVWILVALHLSGILPEIALALEEVKFNIGKNPVNLLVVLQGLLTVIATIFIALWLSRLIENKLMRTEQLNINMRVVLTKLVRIVFVFLAVLIALSAVGLDITLLSVFGGALGVGLGFGLQKIASNYVSGFIILVDRSVQIGDLITVDAHYGTVKELRSRYMVLRKLDSTEVIIPNEMMITGVVINHKSSLHKVRVQMPIQVAYDTELEQVIDILRDETEQAAQSSNINSIDVHVKGFGEKGIDLVLGFNAIDMGDGAALQSTLYQNIWKRFKQHGIVVPYPQREVRLLNENVLPNQSMYTKTKG